MDTWWKPLDLVRKGPTLFKPYLPTQLCHVISCDREGHPVKYNIRSNKHEQDGLLSWSLICQNALGGETRSKQTKQTLSCQISNEIKGQTTELQVCVVWINELAYHEHSFSVHCACDSQKTCHVFGFERFQKYILWPAVTRNKHFSTDCLQVHLAGSWVG